MDSKSTMEYGSALNLEFLMHLKCDSSEFWTIWDIQAHT